MTSQAESIFPIIPQPMVLAVDTLSRPLRRAPTPSGSVGMSCDKSKADPRLSLFHEDVFSRLLSGPLVIFHFAFYCAVPVYYLAHFSPFSHFEGGGQFNQVIRWALLLLTQYLTAILTVSWFGRYMVRKEVTALVLMLTTMALVAGLKMFMEEIVVSKG